MKPTYTAADQVNADGKVVDKIVTITRTTCTEYKESHSITELKSQLQSLEAEKKKQQEILDKINADILEIEEIITAVGEVKQEEKV